MTLAPSERDVAMVFQNYALYPHMTVARNMAFSLGWPDRPKRRSTARAGGGEMLGAYRPA